MTYYERVNLKITEFDAEDVITTSAGTDPAEDPTDPPIWDPYEQGPGAFW